MSHCVYQGSFNPIHNAHIAVAKHAHDIFGFEKIVFIPAYRPPHKPVNEFDAENALHRLNMVELAVEDYPYFDVSAIEYTRDMPSYTYDTILRITSIVKPKEKINFIIGSDAFINIESWNRAEKLKELIKFILFVREDNFDENKFKILQEKGYEYDLMKMPFYDISSSMIRKKLEKKENVDDKLPEKVAEYIKKNNVYKIHD